MNKQKVIPYDLLDIIFQDRNKNYGAYVLRRTYHERMKRSFFISITLIGIAFSIPVLSTMYKHPAVTVLPHLHKDTNIIICEFPTPEDPPIKVDPPAGGTNQEIIPVIIDADSLIDQRDTTVHLPTTIDGPSVGDLPGRNPFNGRSDSSTQVTFATPSIPKTPDPVIIEPSIPGEMAEVNASFPGGDEALAAFIREHLQFTKSALHEELQGKVVVSFIVNTKGELSDFEILRSVGYGMDEEVLRVMNKMPNWKVANTHGRKISVRYTLPIALETTN